MSIHERGFAPQARLRFADRTALDTGAIAKLTRFRRLDNHNVLVKKHG